MNIQSPAEQVAAHLRNEILSGKWHGEMPGAPRLSGDLGVDAKTIFAALNLLELEGLLVSQGVGRRRQINHSSKRGKNGGKFVRAQRIGILLNQRTDRRIDYLGEIQHGLVQAGHSAFFASKAQNELGTNQSRLAKLIKTEKADAWIIISGERELLQWFSDQPFPVFAVFGRFSGLPIAAVLPEKIPAYREAVDKLVALGHRRITFLARKSRRLPEPGRTERAFLQRLEDHGIATGSYNLPDWEDDETGFQKLLEELFRVTPPTALIIQEPFLFGAAYHFLARRGLSVPKNVSMICSDDDSYFAWHLPPVTRIRWDAQPIVRRVVKWVANVTLKRNDERQTFTKAEFVEGGTIGICHGSTNSRVSASALYQNFNPIVSSPSVGF